MNIYEKISNEMKLELLEYIKDSVSYSLETSKDTIKSVFNDESELFHNLFNTCEYYIYNHDCLEFIEKEFGNAFDAIEIVQTYEQTMFGESNTILNEYNVANMLIYIIGEHIIYNVLDIRENQTLKQVIKNINEAKNELYQNQ